MSECPLTTEELEFARTSDLPDDQLGAALTDLAFPRGLWVLVQSELHPPAHQPGSIRKIPRTLTLLKLPGEPGECSRDNQYPHQFVYSGYRVGVYICEDHFYIDPERPFLDFCGLVRLRAWPVEPTEVDYGPVKAEPKNMPANRQTELAKMIGCRMPVLHELPYFGLLWKVPATQLLCLEEQPV